MEHIFSDQDGPGTPFVLINRGGLEYPVTGTYGDIGLLMDPATGTAVQGQTITAVFPMGLLSAHTLEKPMKGWKVKLNDPHRGELSFFVVDPPVHDYTIGMTRLILGTAI